MAKPQGRIFRGANKRFHSRVSGNLPRYFPTGDIVPSGSSKQGFIGGALVSLMITLLLSFGAIYSLNRYLDAIEDPPTSSLRHPAPTN